MALYDELVKIAEDVEQNGFAEDNEIALRKTTHAAVLLHAIEQEIEKTAAPNFSFGKKLADGLAQTAIVGLSVAVAGRAADSIEKAYDKHKFNKKAPYIIEFAQHENPSLKNVSNGKLKAWLNSAYSISPKVAKDPMLATSYLSTAHAVNGVDMNTAKTIAEIQQRGGKDYNKAYDAIRGASSMLPSSVVEL